jgi:hypothetical protein
MSWFTTSTSINWLTIFLVGFTMFMVGGGAQTLLEVDKKDTEVLEYFLKIAKWLGTALTCAGAGLGIWIWLR